MSLILSPADFSLTHSLVRLSSTSGLPRWLSGKESAYSAGDTGSIPGSGRPPLEEEVATHSSILAGKIPWTEESAGQSP